ncbi:MAG: hypothetical protein AAGF24_15525, partial [Cyanobacteria bacterium P01_H01_bin.121]
EIGYRSAADAAIKPWEWPNSSEQRPSVFATTAGLETQANCYQAFFEVVWSQAWLAGVYWWKWFPEIYSSRPGDGFTPQDKPAEQILKRWYQAPLNAQQGVKETPA